MSSAEVEDYLAALPEDQRTCLAGLRARIARHLPATTECLSHAMPGFRHASGRMVAGYAAFSRHLGFYPHSGTVIRRLGDACAGFRTSKSGILFTPDHPLPDALLHHILDLRLAEIATLAKAPPRP